MQQCTTVVLLRSSTIGSLTYVTADAHFVGSECDEINGSLLPNDVRDDLFACSC